VGVQKVVVKKPRRKGHKVVAVPPAASARREKVDRIDSRTRPAKFIGQSFRSNYCGVYATGMLLSLLGFPTTRENALDLFKLKRSNRDYRGASHEEIADVLCHRVAKFGFLHWQYYRRFDFASLAASLVMQLKVNHRPTLLSFGAIHQNGEWKCTHAAVVIDVKENRIELLDPLAKPPLVSSGANVCIYAASPQLVSVIGSSYSIDLKSEAAVLLWTERRASCLEAE
jgi:hypothetical protein